MFLLTTVGIVGHYHSPIRHNDRLPPFCKTSLSASFAAKQKLPPQGPGSEYALPILHYARNIRKIAQLCRTVNGNFEVCLSGDPPFIVSSSR